MIKCIMRDRQREAKNQGEEGENWSQQIQNCSIGFDNEHKKDQKVEQEDASIVGQTAFRSVREIVKEEG